MKNKSNTIKNILVVRTDRFGEFLLIIPALRALKETFAGARITAVVSPVVAELAACVPFIDELIVKPAGPIPFRRMESWVNKIGSHRFDIVVMFNPSKEFNIITCLCRIPLRVGYARKMGFLLTNSLPDMKHLGRKHEIDYNLQLVESIGAKTYNRKLSLNIDGRLVSEAVENFAQTFMAHPEHPIVAIHPFTSDPVKQWPLENFRLLADKLTREPGVRVVFIGRENASVPGYEYFNVQGGALASIVNKTKLPELAVLLKRCKVLVSGDSGPVHLASSVGIPSVALFRNDMEGKTARRWGPVSKNSLVLERRLLSEIPVDEVALSVKAVLNGGSVK